MPNKLVEKDRLYLLQCIRFEKRVVYLYHFYNFQNVVGIDLGEELRKGRRPMDLPALFPKTFVAEKFQNDK